MLKAERDLHGDAARWHTEIDQPYMDWAAFESWLSAGPDHRRAYDEIAILDAEIEEHRKYLAAVLFNNTTNKPVHASSPRPARIAVAASMLAAAAIIVAVMVGPFHQKAGQPPVVIATALNGRSLVLADGSRLGLDRDTRVALSMRGAVNVQVYAGTANFRIRHDPTRTILVHAGGYDIRDVGTTFDVSVSAGHLSVAVAEGQVGLRRSGAEATDETMLGAGQRIDLDPAKGTAMRSSVTPQSISAWERGQLSYNDAPLSIVGADVSRYVDRPLVVDPSAADVRFSGVLTIGNGSRLVDQLKAVLPINSRLVGGVVHLRRTSER